MKTAICLLLVTQGVGTAIQPSASARPPEVLVLRALAHGELTVADLDGAISACARVADQDPCAAVLEQIAKAIESIGKESEKKVLTGALERLAGSETASDIALAKRMVEARSDAAPKKKNAPWFREFASEGPLLNAGESFSYSRAAQGRLLAYVDQFLPINPDERVHAALVAASATTCEKYLNGFAISGCREVGLARLRLASLTLAVAELKGSEGDEAVVNRYLREDPLVLASAFRISDTSSDDQLPRYTMLLRSWMRKAPASKWEAWADILVALGSP